VLLGYKDEYVHERAPLILAEAAGRLGLGVDVDALAPSRRRLGPDTGKRVLRRCQFRFFPFW